MRTPRVRVYDPRGREIFLTEGQIAPAGWFRDGRPPTELTREHRVVVFAVRGEDMDMDADDPANVRRVVELETVWTPEEIEGQAQAEADRVNAEITKKSAEDAAHQILVAQLATRNLDAGGGVWEIHSLSVRLTPADRAAGQHYRIEERVIFIKTKKPLTPEEISAKAKADAAYDGGGSGYGRHGID